MIEFISHEYFHEDPYIKELVYLQIDPQTRIAYIRKPMKNGGLLWAPISFGVIKNGVKKFIDSIEFDSNFLKKAILAFLEARSWESKAALHHASPTDINHAKPPVQSQMSFFDNCPF